MLPAKDISKYQGAFVDTGEPIVMVKISGGDAGLYVDPDAASNYNGVIAAGKAFGGYHFAGGTDPVSEANFYLAAMKPWNQGEVPALDWEISNPDPVSWVTSFVNQVHSVAGAWPLVYMNLSTLNAHDWAPVLKNCGLWLADWNNDPKGTIQTNYTYVMQQYNDGPNYDHDEWYGTLAEFKDYGWPATTPVVPPPAPPAPPASTSTESTSSTTSFSSTTTLPPAPPSNGNGTTIPMPPKPVQNPSTGVTVVEHDAEKVASFVWSKYNKAFTALIGTAVTWILHRYHVTASVPDITAALTVLGVLSVPNSK